MINTLVCYLQKYFKDNCVLTPAVFSPYLVNIFMKVVFNERVARQDLHIFDELVVLLLLQ